MRLYDIFNSMIPLFLEPFKTGKIALVMDGGWCASIKPRLCRSFPRRVIIKSILFYLQLHARNSTSCTSTSPPRDYQHGSQISPNVSLFIFQIIQGNMNLESRIFQEPGNHFWARLSSRCRLEVVSTYFNN